MLALYLGPWANFNNVHPIWYKQLINKTGCSGGLPRQVGVSRVWVSLSFSALPPPCVSGCGCVRFAGYVFRHLRAMGALAPCLVCSAALSVVDVQGRCSEPRSQWHPVSQLLLMDRQLIAMIQNHIVFGQNALSGGY